MMEEIYTDLLPHIEATTFPPWLIDELKPLGVNGFTIKGYGSPGVSTPEYAAVIYELAKRDQSVSTFVGGHNALGLNVIEAFLYAKIFQTIKR